MATGSNRVLLPVVRGWPPPPTVTVPVYEIPDWPGPQWLLLYDGTDAHGGLRFVHLAYGDALTRKFVAGVLTFVKQPVQDLGNGVWAAATGWEYVADSTVLRLLELLPHPAPTEKARRAWERERLEEVSTDQPGPPHWFPVSLELPQTELAGYRTEIDDGWAVCLDAGEGFVAIYGTRPLPSPLVIAPLVDLSRYPMPDARNLPG